MSVIIDRMLKVAFKIRTSKNLVRVVALNNGGSQQYAFGSLEQCRFMASQFVSPFNDDEVYDGHHTDLEKRDGPLLIGGNTADHLVIGGGVMGQALSYSLWRHLEKFTLVKAKKMEGAGAHALIERDPTLHQSASALAVGGIRTQFSNRGNVKFSLNSAEFIREIRLNLSTVRNQNPDVQFNPQGYLVLATASGAEQLVTNYNTQTAAGAKIMLFTQDHLKETFPWMNVDDIELAAYGVEFEGWFDPISLVNSFKSKNTSFPITNITGEVVGFKKEIFDEPQKYVNHKGRSVEIRDRIDGVYIKMKEYDKPVYIKCFKIFVCGGPWSGKIAELAGIGTDKNHPEPLLRHKLPVEPRKRYVYVVHCPDAPLLDLPFVVDTSGIYVRRDGLGGKYLCGMSPPEDKEPSTDNLDVDYDFFYEEVWPRLAERIPAFEKLKLVSAWAGFYDYNTFDQNAIIGPHPYYHDLYFLTGFSGHGIQQAWGASDKLADYIVNGNEGNEPHELEPFFFDRIIENRPVVEYNII